MRAAHFSFLRECRFIQSEIFVILPSIFPSPSLPICSSAAFSLFHVRHLTMHEIYEKTSGRETGRRMKEEIWKLDYVWLCMTYENNLCDWIDQRSLEKRNNDVTGLKSSDWSAPRSSACYAYVFFYWYTYFKININAPQVPLCLQVITLLSQPFTMYECEQYLTTWRYCE